MSPRSTEKSIFVVTLPLKTEKWQEDRINKMMRLLTVFYNEKQKALIEKWLHISHSKEYQDCKAQPSMSSVKDYMRDYGYSEFGLKEFFIDKKFKEGSPYSINGLNSAILRNLAIFAWSAWEKKLTNKKKHIFINTDKDVNIIKTNLKVKKDTNTGEVKYSIIGFDIDYNHYTITMKAEKPHRHAIFTIPFIVNRNSEYEIFALGETQKDCSKLKNLAIVRKEIRGKYKYYVQFSIEGIPYNKGRELGEGVVGIDPGPGKIAVVSDKEVRVAQLAESIEQNERETILLQRKLDRSRRAMNPDEYNEDGTIKKKKHNWVKSKHYEEIRIKLAESQRKLAARRKIAHNELANELLTLGNEFHVEDNKFKTWQGRAKETTFDKNGRCRSKSRFGKTLGKCAPSEFFTILENKVKRLENGKYVDIPDSTACTAYDFTNKEFTKHHLKERTITTSDGVLHDRDTLAAFNMKFVRPEKVIGRKKVEKAEANFDNEAMSEFYPEYCEMEKQMK